MNHLLRPEGVESFIRVTYNERESEYYDGEGFMGFPKRRGWTEQDLLGANNFGGRSSEDVERFFQAWLFFGMAIEVLKAARISVQTEDFLRSEPGSSGHVIHTERLPSMLIEWKSYGHCRKAYHLTALAKAGSTQTRTIARQRSAGSPLSMPGTSTGGKRRAVFLTVSVFSWIATLQK
jgi:hypothetical protein